MRFLPLLPILFLAGCANDVIVPSKLEGPSARLMIASNPLPEVKEGDDLVQTAAQCRAEYGRESGRLTGLQGYVRTILKKQ